MILSREPGPELYDLMREYLGARRKGTSADVDDRLVPPSRAAPPTRYCTAAAIEFFHNGFLVHDDISDESTSRRNLPTLHEAHGR